MKNIDNIIKTLEENIEDLERIKLNKNRYEDIDIKNLDESIKNYKTTIIVLIGLFE